VDRVDRRRLMVTIDWIRVVAMGLLATAMLAGRASIALLDAVLFVINSGEVIFRSASQAMIPSVVPRARLERANGWLVGGTTMMQQMIAGPLGGFLFVVAACVPFFVNAGTYAVSAVLIGLVAGTYRTSVRPEADGDGRLRRTRAELAEGFRWLAHQRVLRTMTVLIGLLNLTLTAATAVLVPPQMLGRVASTSLFIAAGGNCVGAVLGGVVAARFGITAPYWAGFVVAIIVSATTWRVFDRATVARAYAEPAPGQPAEPEQAR